MGDMMQIPAIVHMDSRNCMIAELAECVIYSWPRALTLYPICLVAIGYPFVKLQAMAFRILSIIRKVSYITYVEKD